MDRRLLRLESSQTENLLQQIVIDFDVGFHRDRIALVYMNALILCT